MLPCVDKLVTMASLFKIWKKKFLHLKLDKIWGKVIKVHKKGLGVTEICVFKKREGRCRPPPLPPPAFVGLMTVKNLVYNKLARQNIFFALLTQFWFLLFWLTVIIIDILILIIITINIDFIVLLLLLYFIFATVIIIIALSIINVVYFNLSHFTSYCSYYYDFCLRAACDVYVSHFFFFSSPFSC